MMTRLSACAIIAACASCGPAAADTPDPNRPSHCVAAFGYARTLFMTDPSPEGRRAVREMDTRATFALRGTTAAQRDAARAEGLALLKSHAGNRAEMDALFLACGRKQDADPDFLAAGPALMKRFREREAH